MNIVRGDMMRAYRYTHHFLFTGNAAVSNSGRLVMGAGLAKTVRDSFMGCDKRFGEQIREMKNLRRGRSEHNGMSYKEYGLLFDETTKLGVFQVKYHFKDFASMSLIRLSAYLLREQAISWPDERYDLNCPGIGNGKLPVAVVMPTLEEILGDVPNVFIWHMGELDGR